MTPARYLARHERDLVKFLQTLVRLRTVNPPGENYGAITRLLADTLRGLGFQVRRVPVPRALQRRTQPDLLAYPRYNVIGFHDAGAKQTVHFNAHFDVVPAAGEWRHRDPFSGKVDGAWIYGRGTSDMKGAIASIVYAFQALRATGTRPNFNLEVSFTADEETDSTLGSEWVSRHGRLRADYAIVGEGGEGDHICCGHNGVVWLNVRVHGRAAHGSTPERGVNALEKMSALVLALGDYQRILGRHTFRTPDGLIRTPTLNVGGVFSAGAGGKINTVPASACFSIDRRVLPDETVAAAERDLRAFLAKAAAAIPRCRITIEKVSDNHSCFRDPGTPFATALRASVSRVRRRSAKFTVSTGFNDMHFFANVRRIPTLGYGPGGQNYHAVDERARIKDLVEAATIYTDLLTTFRG